MYREAERIAIEAGEIAMRHFRDLAFLPVESKGHLDLVTEADKGVERFLIDALRQGFPDDGVFGEEGSNITGTSGRTWVVDPIDGTFNFVRGGDQWAVSIGLYEDSAPKFGVIHAPAREETYVGGTEGVATLNGSPLRARQGVDWAKAATNVGFHPIIPVAQRVEVLDFVMREARMMFKCCGSATISLMQLACGEVDGYIGMGESSWDLMAALAILKPLGIGSTIDWSAAGLNTRFKFAAGTPEFLKAIRPAVPFGAKLAL